VKSLGLLVACVPFAFAARRLIATGNDLRYTWMAVASALCAAAVLVWPGTRTAGSRTRLGVAAIAATLCAAAVPLLLGATAVSGIAIVAIAFGLCSAFGTGLIVRSRARDSG
jgi:hypothetical protein